MKNSIENSSAAVRLRRASRADAPAVLRLFDEAIEWFLSFGNTQQWGSEPWSTQDRQIARVTEACELPGAWVAVDASDTVCGALVLGEAMPYVPAAEAPEVYVRLLIASRDPRARGVGRMLLGIAEDQARATGVEQLRVDCYAGGDEALVRFYESCGYQRQLAFDVDGWPGQVLIRHLR